MRDLTLWEKFQSLDIDDLGEFMLKVLCIAFCVVMTVGCAAGVFQLIKWGFK